MEICIDFDGTCVSHAFPELGVDIGAVPVLKRLVEAGHNLILFTMRSDQGILNPPFGEEEKGPKDCNYLSAAVKWFADNGITLHGIQKNPTQDSWTSSPKAYGQLYIDDAALGCPLLFNKAVSSRPYVDWKKVEEFLESKNII